MARCNPPKPVQVGEYYRKPPRKKRKARQPAPGPYWVVVSDRGTSCGHRHKSLSGAVACRKRHERAERAARAYRGKGSVTHYHSERHAG